MLDGEFVLAPRVTVGFVRRGEDGSSTGRLPIGARTSSETETGSSTLGTWMRTNAYFFVSEIVVALYRSSIVPHCHSL